MIMEQRTATIDLSHHLVAMYFDESFDPIWREYCIQFIGTWYKKENSKDKRDLLKYVFKDALKDTSNFAGTAILGCFNLAAT